MAKQVTPGNASSMGAGASGSSSGSGSAERSATSSDQKKLLKERLPLARRVLYGVAVWLVQNLVVRTAMAARHLRHRLFPPNTLPTATKTYACRPKLPVRIFFPRSYDQLDPRPLPLLFSIHGGGFVLGEPSDNDTWNTIFANKHSAVVVALNYAKAPRNRYPGPRKDLEALVAAVLADDELAAHIDTGRVGMAGFSAGGNLALTTSQAPAVRARITAGVVPVYPVTDLSISSGSKAATRRYKAALGGFRGRPSDLLLPLAAVFDGAYIAPGQDLCDPLLSPLFASRAALPRRVWLVGCELDILAHEALRLACRLAGRRVPRMDEPVGQEDVEDGGRPGTLVTAGDERFAWEARDAHGDVRWLLVADACHGFDMASQMTRHRETIKDGDLKRDALIAMMGEWLYPKDVKSSKDDMP